MDSVRRVAFAHFHPSVTPGLLVNDPPRRRRAVDWCAGGHFSFAVVVFCWRPRIFRSAPENKVRDIHPVQKPHEFRRPKRASALSQQPIPNRRQPAAREGLQWSCRFTFFLPGPQANENSTGAPGQPLFRVHAGGLPVNFDVRSCARCSQGSRAAILLVRSEHASQQVQHYARCLLPGLRVTSRLTTSGPMNTRPASGSRRELPGASVSRVVVHRVPFSFGCRPVGLQHPARRAVRRARAAVADVVLRHTRSNPLGLDACSAGSRPPLRQQPSAAVQARRRSSE